METSTAEFATAVASNTGAMVQSSLGLFYLLFGFFLVVVIIGIVVKTVRRSARKAMSRY